VLQSIFTGFSSCNQQEKTSSPSGSPILLAQVQAGWFNPVSTGGDILLWVVMVLPS
jgi:hypothetical protein